MGERRERDDITRSRRKRERERERDKVNKVRRLRMK